MLLMFHNYTPYNTLQYFHYLFKITLELCVLEHEHNYIHNSSADCVLYQDLETN